MFIQFTKPLTTAVMVGAFAIAGATAVQAQNMAHTHMGHVTDGWNDTPDGMGLLPTALAEAEIAATHAGLAAEQPDNLDWMKTHSLHVLHAVDAGAIEAGPGLGYGVRQASEGVVAHIGFASEADSASDNVKLHAQHVTASANNTIGRVDAIATLVGEIQAASDAAAAAARVAEMQALTAQLKEGTDANGDGGVSWHEGEGGLAEVEKHMGLMRQGEGL